VQPRAPPTTNATVHVDTDHVSIGKYVKQTTPSTDESINTFPESIIRCLTGPQPYSKTVPNHTVKIRFLLFVSQLLASCIPLIISVSIFSQSFATDRSNWYPHCQLSLSLIRVDSVYPYKIAKMGIHCGDTAISANSHSLRMPLAANVCSKMISIQRSPWNQFIPSITAVARAGSIPMVPEFRSFINQ